MAKITLYHDEIVKACIKCLAEALTSNVEDFFNTTLDVDDGGNIALSVEIKKSHVLGLYSDDEEDD